MSPSAHPMVPAPVAVGMAVPGMVVAFAQVGDALLYAVLPIHAEEFGVSLFMVGVLLSLNRWTRLVANSLVAHVGRNLGPRRLMLAAAVGAAASTLGYALAGESLLVASRMLWGLSFAGLNLSVLAYAVSDPTRAGSRVAAGRTSIATLQALSLIIGSWAVAPLGARGVFLALAGVSLVSVLLACRLPALPADTEPAGRFRLPWPGRLEVWVFCLGLVVDGIFVVTLSLLLRGQSLPAAWTPVMATGSLLAARWAVEILTAPIGGRLADRFGARPLAMAAGALLIGGLLLIASGHGILGAAVVVTMRGLFNTLNPIMVAAASRRGTMSSQATNSTWRDFGAAIGPVVAGFAFSALPQPVLYGVSAVIIALALGWSLALPRWRPGPADTNRATP